MSRSAGLLCGGPRHPPSPKDYLLAASDQKPAAAAATAVRPCCVCVHSGARNMKHVLLRAPNRTRPIHYRPPSLVRALAALADAPNNQGHWAGGSVMLVCK